MSILCYRVQPNIHSLSKRRLSLKSRGIGSLCRPAKRISCLKMLVYCNVSDLKFYLKLEFYSYDDLNWNFDKMRVFVKPIMESIASKSCLSRKDLRSLIIRDKTNQERHRGCRNLGDMIMSRR